MPNEEDVCTHTGAVHLVEILLHAFAKSAHKVFDPYTELSHSSSAEQTEKPLSGFSNLLPEHHINIPLLFNREYMSGMAQQLYLIRLMETSLQ